MISHAEVSYLFCYQIVLSQYSLSFLEEEKSLYFCSYLVLRTPVCPNVIILFIQTNEDGKFQTEIKLCLV